MRVEFYNNKKKSYIIHCRRFFVVVEFNCAIDVGEGLYPRGSPYGSNNVMT